LAARNALAAVRAGPGLAALVAAAVLTGLAALLAALPADGHVPIPLRVVLILGGLVLALVGVNQRLRAAGATDEERALTACYLALAALVTLLAWSACSPEWDSCRMLLGVFIAVGLAGAVLVLLPTLVRRAVILVLVLFHFAGILTAVFSVAPPSGVSCWTANVLWTYIYRPYLQFMYLNNAYHFYSPEPGPARQLWFHVRYEDPKLPPRWVVVPRRDDFPSRLAYQRHLAMTESTVTLRYGLYPPDIQQRQLERAKARYTLGIPYYYTWQTDHRELAWPDLSQYQEPNDLSSKRYIASYARYIANDPRYRDPDAPDVLVASVRVYRVTHTILSAPDMARDADPQAVTTLLPFYMGKFDRDGNLLDPDDPMLYWLVPPVGFDAGGNVIPKDYVAVHAGDTKSPVADR
jgi:hypothetical protein